MRGAQVEGGVRTNVAMDGGGHSMGFGMCEFRTREAAEHAVRAVLPSRPSLPLIPIRTRGGGGMVI